MIVVFVGQAGHQPPEGGEFSIDNTKTTEKWKVLSLRSRHKICLHQSKATSIPSMLACSKAMNHYVRVSARARL